MRTSKVAWLSVWLAAVVTVTGCAKQREREELLVGTWKPTLTGLVGMAPGMAKEAGSPLAALGASAVVNSVSIEFRKDKTFDMIWGGNTGRGTWTFNKDTGESVLSVTAVGSIVPSRVSQTPPQQPKEPLVYTVYMDPDNKSLRFFPMPPSAVAFTKQAGEGKGLSNGILLKKEE